MTKKRKLVYRPAPIVKQTTELKKDKSFKNKDETQKIISKYHALNKKLNQLKANDKNVNNLTQIKEIEQQLDQIGGLQKYQKASLQGQSIQNGGDSSKWLINNLPHDIKPRDGKKIQLLDVGALANNYMKYQNWINLTAIDLNPQTDFIKKFDFMEFPVDESQFDILCLSLVINFVPDPLLRGQMLRKSILHLKNSGYLFIVLPKPCIQNSRYLTDDLFQTMLNNLGYKLIKQHFSQKLAFYLFQLNKIDSYTDFKYKKTLIRDGKGMNNFCIVFN